MTGTPVRIPVYQKKLDIFNCLDYLICLHIHNNGHPYQYTFSGNWGFYYYAADEFMNYEKGAENPPFYANLSEIYHMKMNQAEYTNLIDHMEEGAGSSPSRTAGTFRGPSIITECMTVITSILSSTIRNGLMPWSLTGFRK